MHIFGGYCNIFESGNLIITLGSGIEKKKSKKLKENSLNWKIYQKLSFSRFLEKSENPSGIWVFLVLDHSVWKSPKKYHSILRAKRATFQIEMRCENWKWLNRDKFDEFGGV